MSEIIHVGPKDSLTTIDGNYDFVAEDGRLFVAGVSGEADISTVNANIRRHHTLPFGYRAASSDRHPADGHIEYSIFGEHCVEATPGQKYHPDLAEILKGVDELLIKGMDPALISYSIVISPAFGKHIASLREKGIERVFVDGYAFTHCVGEAAIAYASQLFETYVVRDATRSVAPPFGDPEAMTKKLELYGVKLITSDQLQAD